MPISTRCPKAIAFVTLGSLGDLHPCLALGEELKRRGHSVKIITTEIYRPKVERLGLGFCPMRPNWDLTSSYVDAQCQDLKRGPEVLFRKVILPHLRDTYDDLVAAIQGADLMVAGELVYAAPVVAEKLSLRWASLILSPCSFFSSHDPSVLVNAPWMMPVRRAGVWPYRVFLNMARLGTKHWWAPVRELRKKEGLDPNCDPLMRDKYSPHLVLGLFSSWLARRQPDWPKQTLQPGFVFHDHGQMESACQAHLRDFLGSGDRPIVFTLGSTAVAHPGNFYDASIEAVRRMSARAVLIGATKEMQRIAPNILSLPYVPYSEIFPSACVIVHPGGAGTTAQALRAGRPMLFVPWGWDQPDNAARVERRGAALSIPKNEYTAPQAADALHRLMTNPEFSTNAAAASAHIQAERGLAEAAEHLEGMLI